MKIHSPYTAPGLISFTPLLRVLLRELCSEYQVRVKDIKGISQKRKFTDVRQVYAYAASVHYPDITHAEIGDLINNSNSNINTGIIRGLHWVLTEKKYRDGYNNVRKRLFPHVAEITKSVNRYRKNKTN